MDSNGVVTNNGFNGFLSADKKTIVGTVTDPGTLYQFVVIQVTGQTYTAGALPDAAAFSHTLVCGDLTGWTHETVTVASGNMTPGDFVTSNSSITSWSLDHRYDQFVGHCSNSLSSYV